MSKKLTIEQFIEKAKEVHENKYDYSKVEYINNHTGIDYYNLGTGVGYSVLEIVNAFSEVNNVSVPYEIVARRDGDIAECYADTSYAKEKLHWEAERDLSDMVSSAYNYVVKNHEKE